MIEDPELALGVEKDRDDLAGGGGDFVVPAVELNVGAGVDLACCAQRKVEVEQ